MRTPRAQFQGGQKGQPRSHAHGPAQAPPPYPRGARIHHGPRFDITPQGFDMAPQGFDMAPQGFDIAPEERLRMAGAWANPSVAIPAIPNRRVNGLIQARLPGSLIPRTPPLERHPPCRPP